MRTSCKARFQTQVGKGTHLEFLGAYVCGSDEKNALSAFFSCKTLRDSMLEFKGYTMLQLTTVFFLIAFASLAGLHIIASNLFLYWHFLWLDIPMHVFGGVIVALGFFTLRDLKLFPNKWLKLIPVLVLVFCVAIIWEVWEVLASVTDMEILNDYIIDTTIDFCMGLLGGVVGYFIGKSLRKLGE